MPKSIAVPVGMLQGQRRDTYTCARNVTPLVSSLPGCLISILVFSKLFPKWDFKRSGTIIPNTFFHEEAGLLGSELTSNDCFLLEMAQDGLAFGAALPAHRQGVQDLGSIGMSCVAGVYSETLLFNKAVP